MLLADDSECVVDFEIDDGVDVDDGGDEVVVPLMIAFHHDYCAEDVANYLFDVDDNVNYYDVDANDKMAKIQLKMNIHLDYDKLIFPLLN